MFSRCSVTVLSYLVTQYLMETWQIEGKKTFPRDATVHEVMNLRFCEGQRFSKALLFLKYILCDIRCCTETNLLTFLYRHSLFQLKSIFLSQMRCLSCWNVCREKAENLLRCVSECAMYGNVMVLGVITSSIKKVSLHTDPDVSITHGYVFTLLDHIYIQASWVLIQYKCNGWPVKTVWRCTDVTHTD